MKATIVFVQAPNPIVKTSDTCTQIVQCYYIVHQFEFHEKSDINEKKKCKNQTHTPNKCEHVQNLGKCSSNCFLSLSFHISFDCFLESFVVVCV